MNDMRQGTCPLCGHNEIIEAKPHALAGGGAGYNPLHVTATGFGGLIWSYTCRQCDFTQLFAQGASMIPVNADVGTRLVVGPAGAGPFR